MSHQTADWTNPKRWMLSDDMLLLPSSGITTKLQLNVTLAHLQQMKDDRTIYQTMTFLMISHISDNA